MMRTFRLTGNPSPDPGPAAPDAPRKRCGRCELGQVGEAFDQGEVRGVPEEHIVHVCYGDPVSMSLYELEGVAGTDEALRQHPHVEPRKARLPDPPRQQPLPVLARKLAAQGVRGWLTWTTASPTPNTSPMHTSVSMAPEMVRFSEKAPGSSWRPSAFSQCA